MYTDYNHPMRFAVLVLPSQLDSFRDLLKELPVKQSKPPTTVSGPQFYDHVYFLDGYLNTLRLLQESGYRCRSNVDHYLV